MTGKAQKEFAPERASTVLLLVDVLNDLEFEGGDALEAPALAMADAIAGLMAACRKAAIPVIYANDNFGRWQSNIDQLIRQLLDSNVRGTPLVRRLRPAPEDYRVLKPEHSAFFASPLDLLLRRMEVNQLILAGLTTDRCVTFTASDAHMRNYRLYVPRDCCAAMSESHHQEALALLERVTAADVRPWSALDLSALAA